MCLNPHQWLRFLKSFKWWAAMRDHIKKQKQTLEYLEYKKLEKLEKYSIFQFSTVVLEHIIYKEDRTVNFKPREAKPRRNSREWINCAWYSSLALMLLLKLKHVETCPNTFAVHKARGECQANIPQHQIDSTFDQSIIIWPQFSQHGSILKLASQMWPWFLNSKMPSYIKVKYVL